MYSFVDYLTQETPSVEKLDQRLKEHPDLLTATDSTGRTFLHWAAQLDSVSKDIVQWAINKGSVVKRQDKYDMTPLDIAAGKGNIEKIELLVKNGDDLQSRDRLNRSVFYRAVLNDAPEATLDYFISQQAFLLPPITEKYEPIVEDEDEVPAEKGEAPLRRVKSNMEAWFDLCDKRDGRLRLQVYFAAVSRGYTHVLEALVKRYPGLPADLKQFNTRTKLISVAVQHHQVELLRAHYRAVILGYDGHYIHLSIAIAKLSDDIATPNLEALLQLLMQISGNDFSSMAFFNLIGYLCEQEKPKILGFLCKEYLPKHQAIKFSSTQICQQLDSVAKRIKKGPAKKIFDILFTYCIQNYRQTWAETMTKLSSKDFFENDQDFFTTLVKTQFTIFCNDADFDGALILTRWVNGALCTELFYALIERFEEYTSKCNTKSPEVRAKTKQFMQSLKESSQGWTDYGKFVVSAAEGVYLANFGNYQEAYEQYQKTLRDYSKFSEKNYYKGVNLNIAELILKGCVEINDAYPERDIATKPLLAVRASDLLQEQIDIHRQINNRILCKRASQAYRYIAKYKDHPEVKRWMTRIHWMLAGFAEVDENARTLPPLLPESLRRFTAYHLSFLPYPVADFVDEQLFILANAYTEAKIELAILEKVLNEKDKWKQYHENQFLSDDENEHSSNEDQDANRADQTTTISRSPSP